MRNRSDVCHILKTQSPELHARLKAITGSRQAPCCSSRQLALTQGPWQFPSRRRDGVLALLQAPGALRKVRTGLLRSLPAANLHQPSTDACWREFCSLYPGLAGRKVKDVLFPRQPEAVHQHIKPKLLILLRYGVKCDQKA